MVSTPDDPKARYVGADKDTTDDEIEWVSKSEMKREMQRFQTLATQLIRLPDSALENLSLPDPVLAAVQEARRLKKDDAVNRQTRHIARQLQQTTDIDALQRKIALFDVSSPVYAQMTQLTERWRDDLITTPDALARFFVEYPEADRQYIGQLARNARNAEKTHQKTASASDTAEPATLQQKKRKLFQALRDAIEDQHRL